MNNYRYLYGPVPSRRLGRSLGVDLVPRKVCTYDCIYCQIGKTTRRTLLRKEYIPVKEVLEEVRAFLSNESAPIDHISLSGSGEPTLHSRMGAVIEEIKRITRIPLAVLTNGSLLFDEEVQKSLLRADVVLPSLDAVSSEIFMKINRPHPKLSVEKVIKGMVDFRKIYTGKIWLEILFCKGVNTSEAELRRMKEAVDRIQPDLIHLNTVVRPPSERWVEPLSPKELERIKDFFGEKASNISEFDRHFEPIPERDLTERIQGILKRRPLSLADLSGRMAIPPHQLQSFIDSLIKEGRLQIRTFGDSVYYEVPKGG
jgi:wyosine [tRNA(Phe)-imidazoG37] synthetase (radical SAM superfamily)